jgi:hypothetical protein
MWPLGMVFFEKFFWEIARAGNMQCVGMYRSSCNTKADTESCGIRFSMIILTGKQGPTWQSNQ